MDTDVVYTTTYVASDASQQYGASFDSWVNFNLNVEFFKFYKHTYTFKLTPLRVMPYAHQLTYNRPASSNGMFDAFFSGSRDITMLEVKTKHIENVKTCGASFVDGAKDSNKMNPSCEYNADNEVKYADSVWKYDVGKLMDHSWYGVQSWFGPESMNNPDNFD